MSQIDDFYSKMESDKNYVDNFVLETHEGTKRLKEKFHLNASQERNNYIEKKIIDYNNSLEAIKNEMKLRFSQLMPRDRSLEYEKELDRIDNYINLVKLDLDISSSFKLNISFVLSSIQDDSSLDDLNLAISKFIDLFHQYDISLSIEDFKYTMFTEEYMKSFFSHADQETFKKVFEKIFFTCPDLKMQLKMNLVDIISKYQKKLDQFVLLRKKELYEKYSVTSSDVVSKYISYRGEIGQRIAMDEYYNTKLFLDSKKKIDDYMDNSPIREKNYNLFSTIKYSDLDDVKKKSFNDSIMDFYLTLNELKKYYRYEFIIKDLIERYKNKDSVKNEFLSKKKEIEKEEKTRLSIYKDYLKACGIGLFSHRNPDKIKDCMLKMNDQVKKLNQLYSEFNDIEITYYLSSINSSASIYDLFMISLKSFPFLEKCFLNKEEFMDEPFPKVIDDFFRFLYNPNNSILRKINVFTDYDLVDVIASKYRLLNLNVPDDSIQPETIDSTLESLRFINLVQNVENSNISFSTIFVLCRIKDILKNDEDS